MIETYWVDTKGGRHNVKNLGWLCRAISSKHVSKVHVNEKPLGEACLIVYFSDPKVNCFISDFASFNICLDWVSKRQWLKGLQLRVIDNEGALNERTIK